MDRREFIKTGLITGAGAAAVVSKPLEAKAVSGTGTVSVAGIELTKMGVKRHPIEDFDELYNLPSKDKVTHFLDRDSNAFGYGPIKHLPGYESCFDFFMNDNLTIEGRPGYGVKDYALKQCDLHYLEGMVYDFHEAAPLNGKYEFSSKDEANDWLKRAAYYVGCDDVGIAPYDERWGFQSELEKMAELKEKFGFVPKTCIVIIVKMPRELVALSPLPVANGIEFVAYSQITNKAAMISQQLNNLGYHALPDKDYLSLNVPYALMAGLTEHSRNGLSISPKFGMSFKSATIYTDMEATPDGPITFGVKEFCESCMKCADVCPSGAISKDDVPTVMNTEVSNTSYPHWAADGTKCLSYWTENHSSCARCIMACPFTKDENWLHQGVRIASSSIPGMHSVAREFDDLFGYGKDPSTNFEKAASKFWNIDPQELRWDKP